MPSALGWLRIASRSVKPVLRMNMSVVLSTTIPSAAGKSVKATDIRSEIVQQKILGSALATNPCPVLGLNLVKCEPAVPSDKQRDVALPPPPPPNPMPACGLL